MNWNARASQHAGSEHCAAPPARELARSTLSAISRRPGRSRAMPLDALLMGLAVFLSAAGWAEDRVSFAVRRDFGVGAFPNKVILADFNMDGVPDLAVTNLEINSVAVLLGRGDGSFAAQRRFAGGSGPCALAAGDFNGDGALDLAVSTSVSSGAISLLLGIGDGTFAPERR